MWPATFGSRPGNEYDSYLLLGGSEEDSDDQRHLSLAEIKNGTNIFHGVELLTLSACNTAVGSGEGSEVENFAVLAQLKGASAVIATLWPVADLSTMRLMQNFYRSHGEHPGQTKIDSLRRRPVESFAWMFRRGLRPNGSERPASSQSIRMKARPRRCFIPILGPLRASLLLGSVCAYWQLEVARWSECARQSARSRYRSASVFLGLPSGQKEFRSGARKSRPLPTLRIGHTHRLRAEMRAQELNVFVDNTLVWEGSVSTEGGRFEVPVGIRSITRSCNWSCGWESRDLARK